MNKEKLNEILKLHKLWLKDKKDGERANLSYADLSSADLHGVDLHYANLRYADLSSANLSGAELICANLYGANLRYADLSSANLSGAELICANLRYANLRYANLYGANLRYADLSSANLSGADLSKISINYLTVGYNLSCPEEGSFIGFKKSGNKIVKFLILEDSLRSSATTRKCRASHIKVLSITSIDGKIEYDRCNNTGFHKQEYVVGEEILIKDFDTDRWNECSTGIHFFLTREEAVNYKLGGLI